MRKSWPTKFASKVRKLRICRQVGIYLRKYDVKVFLFKINTMAEYN